jgi:hypothetical protein
MRGARGDTGSFPKTTRLIRNGDVALAHALFAGRELGSRKILEPRRNLKLEGTREMASLNVAG